MTTKNICQNLNEIFQDFLNLFEDEKLKEKLKKECYFAGGCIYSLYNDKEPKDYDIFLRSRKLIRELKKIKIWNYKSTYAFTVGKIQVITKFYGQPNKCVEQFDFKHNMYYYIPFSEDINTPLGDYAYLKLNHLFFNKDRARDIEGVYLRVEKFLNRGMNISEETLSDIKNKVTSRSIKKYKRRIKRAKSNGWY